MQKITYGTFDTEIGTIIIGTSDKGLCWLGWMVDGYKGNGFDRMKYYYPNALYIEDNAATKDTMNTVMDAWRCDDLSSLKLDYTATPFQQSVWNALLDIKRGQTLTYGEIAYIIGKTGAARAVGTAVGENPISLIIPCHRVLPSTGGVGNYGWGASVKQDLLEKEGVFLSPQTKAA